MSKRYIDADELIECFDGYHDYVEFDVEDIESIINEQDVADVVEVVRCKDCKYRKKNIHYTIPLIDRVESIVFCLRNMRSVNGNGFCSDGERAEA